MDGDAFSSKPFEFVVQGKSYFIHSALVAKVSAPLDRFINGGMLETQNGRAVLKDEDEATFSRFCNWVYTGFYHAAKFSERPKREASTSGETGEGIVLAPSPPPRKTKKDLYNLLGSSESPSPPSKRETLKAAFLKMQYCKPDDARPTWVPRANTAPTEDYTDTFLSHVKLYVFSEKFDIQPLKRLVLNNMHQTLCAFTLWPDCVDDIISLLSLVYECTMKSCDGDEPMRRMLNQYVGYEMEGMVEAPAFRDLLEQDRDFLDDFCSQVRKRI